MIKDNYTILSMLSAESELITPKWTSKMPINLYKWYIQKKLPVKVEEVFYFNMTGQRLKLPYTKEKFEEMEQAQRNKIINRAIEKYKIETLIFDSEVKKLAQSNSDYKWILKYMMFPRFFEKVIRTYGIGRKNMRLVIRDSGDDRTEYILKLLLPDLNYLTIVTERPDYFEIISEDIYENTGLMMEIVEAPVNNPLMGNVVVDLGNHDKRESSFLEKNAVVMLLEASVEQLQYLYQRRYDFKVIYDIDVSAFGINLEKDMAGHLLCLFHDQIKEFWEKKDAISLMELGMEYRRKYNMEITKLMVL
jgi:hypothetical protein